MTTLHIVDGSDDVIDTTDDPTWSDLFEHVRHDLTLAMGCRLLLRPDAELADGRWYYQIECDRPDAITGDIGVGRSGKAYLSPHATLTELVQIAFGLYKSYWEHEAREGFRWRGRQVFGPHIDVAAHWDIADRTEYRP